MKMKTATGKTFDLADPRAEDVCIEDIAAHLAKLCRFNGACTDFYSVAEHSVYVSRCVPSGCEIYGLLHDAHEAYTGDLVGPLKAWLRAMRVDAIDFLQERIQQAIWESCNIDPPSREVLTAVKEADERVLIAERNHLILSPKGEGLYWPDVPAADIDISSKGIYAPWFSHQHFLSRYFELTALESERRREGKA